MVMRPTTLTITSTGTSQAVPFDYYSFGIAVAVEVLGSAACTYTLQHTFTDPGITNLNAAGGGVWINHDDSVMVSASTTQNSNYSFPPRAARLVVAGSAPNINLTFVPMSGM